MDHLRKKAFDAFMAGVSAADPSKALLSSLDANPLPSTSGRLILIAVGKAARNMMSAALSVVPSDQKITALSVTNYENDGEVVGATVMTSAHPVPDENGLAAGRAVCDLLASATADDAVVSLVSGGASALLPAPVDGVSLQDKSAVNELLLSNGFAIEQMNLVRQSLSRLKGGGMLRLASPATVRSYILSDVIGDDLRVVGSGPSVGPLGTVSDAIELLRKASVFNDLPGNVQAYFDTVPTPMPLPKPDAYLIGGNSQSVAAMGTNIDAMVIKDPLEGDVQEAAKTVLKTINENPNANGIAFGGETTVDIKGTGKGGRNQELALRVAQLANETGLAENWVFLSGGTDGRDGSTDAAGGMVDQDTLRRITKAGGDLDALLANNDSYAALNLSGDLLMTGATGTNVADLQVFLRA